MTEEKLLFEEPVVEIVVFDTTDVIENSPGQGEWDPVG